jgi:hypothetical protein
LHPSSGQIGKVLRRWVTLDRKGRVAIMGLTEEERAEVEGFIQRGTVKARVVTRGRIVLKSADGWSIEPIVETLAVSAATVSNVRKR